MEIIKMLVLLLSAWKWEKKTEKLICVKIKIKDSEISRISLVSVLRFTGKDTLILLTDLLSLLLAHHFQETFFFFLSSSSYLDFFLMKTYKSAFAKMSMKDWHLSLPKQAANHDPEIAETKLCEKLRYLCHVLFFFLLLTMQTRVNRHNLQKLHLALEISL